MQVRFSLAKSLPTAYAFRVSVVQGSDRESPSIAAAKTVCFLMLTLPTLFSCLVGILSDPRFGFLEKLAFARNSELQILGVMRMIHNWGAMCDPASL